MIKKLLIIPVVVIASAGSLQAIPTTIDGTIGYDGTFSPANTDLTTPNNPMTILTATLNSALGTFSGGTLSHFASPITINTTAPPGFTNPLWQLTVGAITYSFTATDVTTTQDTKTQNSIEGNGTVSDGLGDTATGTYNMSFDETVVGSLASFSWSGTSGALSSAPDGGTTAILLSCALAGLGLIRRKLV